MNNAHEFNPSAPPTYDQTIKLANNFQPDSYPQFKPNQLPTTPNYIQSDYPSPQSAEERFRQIVQKYEIGANFSNKLQMLHGFKIVFIFDDSGSMSTVLDDSPLNSKGNLMKARRWDELQYYSNISIEIASLFNPNGCDVFFLNRGVVRNVKTSRDLQGHFQNPPSGFTPLRDTFNNVINDNYEASRERKLLVIILTDGEPTDAYGRKSEVAEFKRCLKERQPINNIFVTIVACTDDDNAISYLDRWDREIKHLDVVDDFRNERDQIRRIKGSRYGFSYGDYVVKSLIGSIDPELDRVDESLNCCLIL